MATEPREQRDVSPCIVTAPNSLHVEIMLNLQRAFGEEGQVDDNGGRRRSRRPQPAGELCPRVGFGLVFEDGV